MAAADLELKPARIETGRQWEESQNEHLAENCRLFLKAFQAARRQRGHSLDSQAVHRTRNTLLKLAASMGQRFDYAETRRG